MHITVFGAGGKVGQQVVRLALKHGHSVTAFVHRETEFPHHTYLTLYQGDIHNPQAVYKALRGSDAVISALGSWGTPTKDILSVGMQSIIPAMQQHGIRRIITVTGADTRSAGDDVSRLHRLIHGILAVGAKKVLRDSEKHISMLKASNLDWTVLRSPVMLEFGNPSKYRLSPVRPAPWQLVHRESVARCLLTEAERPENIHAAPYIIRS
jgi:putative NADH-flavin reductase